MSPSQLRAAIEALRWSQRGLAEALACDPRLVRRWAAGDSSIPPEVSAWLDVLAQAHVANPPPTSWRTRWVRPSVAQEDSPPGRAA